jgi:hypothetical protein
MSRNVGTLERVLRVVLGLVILGLYGATEAPLKYVTLLGLIPLGTGLLGSCPIYTLFGYSTYKGGAPAPRP